MNTTVDCQTAKQLRDAGFPQPIIWEKCYYFEDDKGPVLAPTALEIIEQMPTETRIRTWLDKKTGKVWDVAWHMPGFQRDFRHDACPHIAAAKAYIAWKKGLQ